MAKRLMAWGTSLHESDDVAEGKVGIRERELQEGIVDTGDRRVAEFAGFNLDAAFAQEINFAKERSQAYLEGLEKLGARGWVVR